MEYILYIAAILTIIISVLSIPRLVVWFRTTLLQKPELRYIKPKTVFDGFDVEVKNNADKQLEVLDWKIKRRKFLFVYTRDLDSTDTLDWFEADFYIKPYKSEQFELFVEEIEPGKDYKIVFYTNLGKCTESMTSYSEGERLKERLKLAFKWGGFVYGVKKIFGTS